MVNIIKSKIVCVTTLFFFLCSCFAPYLAQAFDTFGDTGQGVGGSTQASGPPANSETGDQPPNCPTFTSNPIYLNSGEEIYQCPELRIPGRGMDVTIQHIYGSGSNDNGNFGFGWTFNYYARLKTLSSGNVLLVMGGRKDEYTFTNGVYVPPAGFFESLVQNGNGTWTLTKAHGEKYQFDVNGVLSSIEDRNQNRITFTYDPGGSMPIIGVSDYQQSGSGQIVIGYDYRLKRITDTVGRFIDLSYDVNGRLATIVDFAGRTLQYGYDPNTNDLTSITFPAISQYPAGIKKMFSYVNHNLVTFTDPRGQVFVTNHYDANGRVDRQDSGSGFLTFNYNVANQTTVTDRKGFVTTYTFNAKGNATRKEQFTASVHAGDPASFVTNYTYNNDMLMTSVTYPKGNGVKFVYDESNPNYRKRSNLLQVRQKASMAAGDNDTNDIVMNVTYDANFNFIKTFTDPKGNVTNVTYDYELPTSNPHYGTNGNLIYIDYPTVAGGNPRVELTYNNYGQIIEVKDPNGILTDYAYVPSTGYLSSIRHDPTGINAITQMTYDAFGYPDTLTDANNHMTDYNYNALGWLIQVKNPKNYLTKYTRDQNGNIIKLERQANGQANLWQTLEASYDVLNNIKTFKDPLGRVTTYNYDNNENLISILDAENHVTEYVYDERDLIFKIKDANSPQQGTTLYDYDVNGNVKKVTDANNHATSYAFDSFDRKFTESYADGKIYKFEYDKNFNLEKFTKPSTTPAVTVQYSYDALNRLTGKTYPAHTMLNASYAYDLGSRLMDANVASAQNHFVYDNLNRIKTNTQTINTIPYVLNYQYDKTNNRKNVVYPSGKSIDYSYDANDNMTFVKVGLLPIANNVYDTLDRRTIPTPQQITPTPTHADYQYDLANQLIDITNKAVGGGLISRYSYPIYDQVGNRKQMQTQGVPGTQTINYAYNNIYELTSVSGSQSHSYSHDLVANRKVVDGTTYVTNTVNQYTQVGAPSFTYDNDGNLIYDSRNTYTYDEENRLKTNVSSETSSYTYDAFNRRVSKTVNGVTTYFINDGDREVEERNAAGVLQADYVYGEGIDEVLSMTRGGQTYYYHYDGLGSVTELTKATGEVVENYTYDPYGTPSITASTIGNPYRFTGRRYDEESGNYYYRQRMYSPVIGRFLQRDPIGYYDSMNLYQYTFNSPINYTDPYGEFTWILPLIGELIYWGRVAWGAYKAYEEIKNLSSIIPSMFSQANDAGDKTDDSGGGGEVCPINDKKPSGEKIPGSDEEHYDHPHGPYKDGHKHWLEKHTDPKTGKTRIVRRTGPLDKK